MSEPLRPGRPGVCAYTRINQCKVNATRRGADWLADECVWFQRAGMITDIGAGFFGGTVYLHAHSRERAQELADLALRHGVPANCVRVVDRLTKQDTKWFIEQGGTTRDLPRHTSPSQHQPGRKEEQL